MSTPYKRTPPKIARYLRGKRRRQNQSSPNALFERRDPSLTKHELEQKPRALPTLDWPFTVFLLLVFWAAIIILFFWLFSK